MPIMYRLRGESDDSGLMEPPWSLNLCASNSHGAGDNTIGHEASECKVGVVGR